MRRGTSPSWTVRANQGLRIIVQVGVGQVRVILPCPVLPLLAVCGRQSGAPRADSASFLDLDVVGQLVCERVVDLLLGPAQADHLLLPGSQDTNTRRVSHRTPGRFRATDAVPPPTCSGVCSLACGPGTPPPKSAARRISGTSGRRLWASEDWSEVERGRKGSAERGREACRLPRVTLSDVVCHPFQQLLPAQVPLVLAPVVVLQGHVGVVELGSAQGTVLVRVLQVGL